MARKKQFKNPITFGNSLSPEQYRAIQLEIDMIQSTKSAEGVVRSIKARAHNKEKKVQEKTAGRARIYNIERFARE